MNRIFLITFTLLSLQILAKQQRMNLQKAIDLKLVNAKALSLGGYQDYCMKLHLKNLINDSLVITVEAGRRFNSLDEKDQDILITREEIIVLKKLEDKWVPVKGYCCQANNHSPSANSKYDVNKLADSNLVMLARFMNTRNFDGHVTQQAIWAISDGRPTAQITSKNDTLVLPLRELVAGIKGEPLPWYTIISKTMVYPSGAMETFPLWLKGKLNYTNDKECYTTLHVLNSKGIEVCQIVKQWTSVGTKDYPLNIPVAGLDRGKYTVELKSTDKQLAAKEFEI